MCSVQEIAINSVMQKKLWNSFFVKLQMKWTAETSSFSSGRPQLLRAAILLDKIQQPFKIEIDGAHGSKIGARCKIKLLTEMLSLIWYERLELSEISEVLPFTSWAQTHGQKPFESELRKILPIYVGRDVTNDAFFHSICDNWSFSQANCYCCSKYYTQRLHCIIYKIEHIAHRF